MRYKVYDHDGDFVNEGILDENIGREIPYVPTHGSLRLEIKDGIWLNLLTSEWMTGIVSDKVLAHDD